MDAIGKKLRKSTKGKSFLPDEIIAIILCRLPTKSVMRCRLVCKSWQDLTFDPHFVELHLKNSIPTILVANPRHSSGLELFPMDKWWECARTRFMIHRFPEYSEKFPKNSRALFSHVGLLVLRDSYASPGPNFTILNLASHEHVRITFPEELWWSNIYGVYYHPLLKEHCSLLGIKGSSSKQIKYKILNLGFNSSLKTIGNPFSSRVAKHYACPLLINNYIYWLLRVEEDHYNGHNDILEFDIIREEFTVLPCPVPLNIECMEHQTCLLNIDGILCFLLASPTKVIIWRLESERLWNSVEYTLSIENCSEILRGIDIEDGKLALIDGNGRLLVCNLMEGTVKKYPKKKYNANVSFLSHHMSLASLKNCKPLISIDKDGEVMV